jgi:hypothetical protein
LNFSPTRSARKQLGETHFISIIQALMFDIVVLLIRGWTLKALAWASI